MYTHNYICRQKNIKWTNLRYEQSIYYILPTLTKPFHKSHFLSTRRWYILSNDINHFALMKIGLGLNTLWHHKRSFSSFKYSLKQRFSPDKIAKQRRADRVIPKIGKKNFQIQKLGLCIWVYILLNQVIYQTVT